MLTAPPHPRPPPTAKLVLIANNCQSLKKSETEYYAMLAKTPVIQYNGSNADLGNACGKFFRVSCMVVTNQGDSDILGDFKR